MSPVLRSQPAMEASNRAPSRSWMRAGASACAAVAAAIAIMALLGWNLGYETLMALEPGFIPVQYNTAIAFLCCSLSLLVLSEGGRRWLAAVAATSALLLAAATATEYLFGADLDRKS